MKIEGEVLAEFELPEPQLLGSRKQICSPTCGLRERCGCRFDWAMAEVWGWENHLVPGPACPAPASLVLVRRK